ncbi:MAG: shikimate dehydrogenase [Candidatus Dasytiphilus stammeri]
MISYALFGNPVKHSKSPRIHQLFAEQMNIKHHTYGSICASLENFKEELKNFFESGAHGANITVPFKKTAYNLSHKLTKRALLAGSVNTIKKLEDNQLLGDNTDGIGLLIDLKRINFIKPKDNILIIGAGGAAYGIIFPLLSYGCSIMINNRTISHAEEIVHRFKKYGNISILTNFNQYDHKFNIIINATSCGIYGKKPELPNKLITPNIYCYDIFYQPKLTPFLQWCKQQGCKQYTDGIGMLVAQAAESFLLWHGVLPPLQNVIKQIKDETIISIP